MSREKIAIDADDVLFDENKAIRLYMNDTYGFTHTANDYDYVGQYWGYWEPIWNLSAEEAERAYQGFLASEYKYNLEPKAHAREVLEKLQRNRDLVIVTSRDKPHVDMTHEALRKHFPGLFDPEQVYFVPLWSQTGNQKASKATIVEAIDAQYLIDDNFEHGVGVAEAGRISLVFGDYGWNRSQPLLPNMKRVLDWFEVETYFDGLG